MTSSYYLAVDVGTSRTAAATARLAPDGSLLATAFALGRNGDSAPSAMFVSGGELLFGDAAERRGITEPERLVREFKRRIGDDVPILAGDQRFTPEEVYALTVAWVVDLVTEREARLPNAIAVTVPVTWGDYRTQLVEDALARHGWSSVTLVTEPEAAARHYESTSPLSAGRALAVYDLGGGTFDAIVLHKDADGAVQIAGAPVGLGDLGGSDFDDAVLRHTLAAAGVGLDSLGSDERMALAALRRECVDAKESLSFDSEVVIPVLLGAGHGTVRLTRDEFEGMIASRVDRTTDALAEALDSAGVDVEDVESILLTGGSSRIPHIAQVLSERFDRPIAIDADPKAIIALGAVRVLSDHSSAPVPSPTIVVAAPVATPALVLATPARAAAPASAAVPDDTVGDAAGDTAAPAAKKARKDAKALRDGKGRKWRLPTFAYLTAGGLVLGIGLVVASTTAISNVASGAGSSSTFIDGLLSAGLSAGMADAAELPAPAVALPQAAQPSADPTQPGAAPAEAVGRRSGPKAAATERAPSSTKSALSAAHSNPAAAGSSANAATAPSGSTGTTGTTTPNQAATTTPAPTQQPTTDPDPEPEPTSEPTTEPTTEPPAEPTEPPADETTTTQSSPAPDPSPSA